MNKTQMVVKPTGPVRDNQSTASECVHLALFLVWLVIQQYCEERSTGKERGRKRTGREKKGA